MEDIYGLLEENEISLLQKLNPIKCLRDIECFEIK